MFRSKLNGCRLGNQLKKLTSSIVRSCTNKKRLNYDYVVMGGGPVGSSVALHLIMSEPQAKILVVEKDMSYAHSSAMYSFGGIRQQFSLPENIQMSMYGIEFIKNINSLKVDKNNVDINFKENGYLFLGNDNTKSALKVMNDTQHEYGASWIKMMDDKQMADQFPWLATNHKEAFGAEFMETNRGITCGSYGTMNEGFFDPILFLDAIKNKAIDHGVEYIEGTVYGSEMSSAFKIDAVKIFTGDKGEKIVGASSFVNCAGASAAVLLEQLVKNSSNPESFKSLPIVPRKRCVFAFEVLGEEIENFPIPNCNAPLVVDISGVYFRPEMQAGSFIASTFPSDKEDVDQSSNDVTEEDYTKLFENTIWPVLLTRVPAFEHICVTSTWAGIYGYNTFDQNAIIGFHSEIQNLVLCNGFSGHGLQQAPAAGRAIAELLTTGRFDTIDLTNFSFERIINSKRCMETNII